MSSIILFQYSSNSSSRTYKYFMSRDQSIEYIFKLYEDYKSIDIDKNEVLLINIFDIVNFIYNLYDFAYFESNGQIYNSYGKDWFCKYLTDYVDLKLKFFSEK
jgi:hypothetical protein